jgi:ABC-type glutathione transport system ATPase component
VIGEITKWYNPQSLGTLTKYMTHKDVELYLNKRMREINAKIPDNYQKCHINQMSFLIDQEKIQKIDFNVSIFVKDDSDYASLTNKYKNQSNIKITKNEQDVHSFEYDSGSIEWKQTNNSNVTIKRLRKYIIQENESSKVINVIPEVESFLNNEINEERVVIITGQPGMGKSTIAAKLSNSITTLYPEKLVINLQLNKFLKEYTEQDNIHSLDEAINFLLNKLLEIKSESEKKKLKTKFESTQ